MSEQGSNIARLSLLKAGFPCSVPGVQVNRKCGSSQTAIHLISQAISSGDMDLGIACGVEMMSIVPLGSDASYKPSLELKSDANILFDVGYPLIHQGLSADIIAKKYNISKQEMEEFAIESHKKAYLSTTNGHFNKQVLPIKIDGILINTDQGIRKEIDEDKIKRLKPAFSKDGLITAALASQISDGSAAVLLASDTKCQQLNLNKRARIVCRVTVGTDPITMLDGIIPATKKIIEKSGISLDEISVFEVNEAFASVVLCWQKTFNVPLIKINPNGGAIAHGHPLGASGCILMTKLVHELERVNGRFGLQTMCIGQGQAVATLIENCSYKM
ncbi:acyltransferase [Acrasis kona]|uniref:Acyltransferase n=1 Tax=Acrasis kona TaxID=1008807 RepID=A0AAW2YNH8_9EUKA